ncbi:hypothetical protein HBH92_181150 [Parastagonospora nodorum]|nr:hypothetical protein HBI10_173700 [Parastagonospora nodorum]KAH4016086.1 hypothetical protein HBI13_153060 [Parastagonospora nodorum]KAH4405256.1 hypothetical protein HBH92_181150 [Parastagonospora nodorum]KAH4426581.1 hypothetical protein HBH93_175200 [Parastagonospora nodorum]KAH4436923.1 hypothetical protein HBH91_194940 [Parastagonospora nodorum]
MNQGYGVSKDMFTRKSPVLHRTNTFEQLSDAGLAIHTIRSVALSGLRLVHYSFTLEDPRAKMRGPTTESAQTAAELYGAC